MFTGLKIGAAIAAGLFVLSTLAGIAHTTWKLNKAVDEYKEATQEVVVEGSTVNAVEELKVKVDNNANITSNTMERLDALQLALESKPEAVPSPAPAQPIVQTIWVEARPKKDQPNETQKEPAATDTVVAMRAIDELWNDFCKRFPSERDCREREDKIRQLQTNPSS